MLKRAEPLLILALEISTLTCNPVIQKTCMTIMTMIFLIIQQTYLLYLKTSCSDVFPPNNSINLARTGDCTSAVLLVMSVFRFCQGGGGGGVASQSIKSFI